MAEALVAFLVENIKRLLVFHARFIIDAKKQVENLEKDLRLFKAILRDSTKKRREDERLRYLAHELRVAVYEAEDIIDAFVTMAAENKAKNYFLRAFRKPVKLHSVALGVASVASKFRYFEDSFDRYGLSFHGVEGPEESEDPPTRRYNEIPVEEDNIVGFKDQVDIIKGYLTEETQQLDVISITGMPGLGKTTLARMIFRDPDIQYQFPTRIWVYVSQERTEKAVFLAILREFTCLTDDMYHKSNRELAGLVSDHLQSGKFLIVMDDVWTIEDWDKLQIALPKSYKMGKILITSRHEEVALYANPDRLPHKLRFLTPEESWLLLQLKVFRKLECPSDLLVLGKLIAEDCEGLPLAIVVVGGILFLKLEECFDMSARINAWREVSESVSTYLAKDDLGERMENIISLGYDKLSYNLKECFLYLGMFPKDFEIPVWKLICMWIAEGFIPQQDGVSLEETAENYLDDLISWDFVRIDKKRLDGTVKTIRVNNMLREFCKTEAGNERENFLQEMKKSNEGDFQPPVSSVHKYHRLCVHFDFLDFITLKLDGPRVRSLVSFSEEEITLPAENISAIPEAFKLLRVLEVKPIKFNKIPSDLYQLIHLRYIVLSSSLAILPADFSKLWNIQTLIVDTSSPTLEIEADIWKMNQLRHLKTNASATLPKVGKSSKGGEKLQTLGTISPQSCTDKFFDRARNLKKLGICGRLTLVPGGKNGSLDGLGKLGNLEKLKLLNDVFPSPSSKGQLRSLLPPYKFPPKLRSLTLSGTYLNWSQMFILGLLENLEVLKLKNKAFMGKCWEADDGGFRRLQVLNIGHTDLVIWVASHHHFPRLRHVKLQNCEKLIEIPIGLADIPSLQLLDLYHTKKAAASAKKILEAKNKQKEETGKVNGFKLCISPLEEW